MRLKREGGAGGRRAKRSAQKLPAEISTSKAQANHEADCPGERLTCSPQFDVVHSMSPIAARHSMQDDIHLRLRGPGTFPATRWSLIVAARSTPRGRAATRAGSPDRRLLEASLQIHPPALGKGQRAGQGSYPGFFLSAAGKGFSCNVRPAAGPSANFFAGVRGPPGGQ